MPDPESLDFFSPLRTPHCAGTHSSSTPIIRICLVLMDIEELELSCFYNDKTLILLTSSSLIYPYLPSGLSHVIIICRVPIPCLENCHPSLSQGRVRQTKPFGLRHPQPLTPSTTHPPPLYFSSVCHITAQKQS